MDSSRSAGTVDNTMLTTNRKALSLTGADSPVEHERLSRVTVEELEKILGTDVQAGLDPATAAARFDEAGPNELSSHDDSGAWQILLRQFQSSVVILLLVASVVSAYAGEPLQCAGILAAVLINAVVGFVSEYRAKVSLDMLSRLAGPTARVRRDGLEMSLPARELVPGDLVLLEPGCRVPADIRLTDCTNMSADESSMTGESVPVYKTAQPPDADAGSKTLAYQGTIITDGRGRGIVIATGDKTRLGQLGTLLSQTSTSRTPLERELEVLGRHLSILTVVICAVLVVVGILQQQDLRSLLETSIALAVAAIPEGLPVLATLALAFGTKRMVRYRTLVRQLAAVETLGCTTVICTDKTGTLTANRMMVTDIILPGRELRLSGQGYEPVGEVMENGAPLCALEDHILVDLLVAGALCNDAHIEDHRGTQDWHVHGDPTEGALIAAAGKAGLDHAVLISRYPRVGELPFDLQRQCMSTIHRTDSGRLVVFSKGSPEAILARCTSVLTPRGAEPLTAEMREWFLRENERLASMGLRVLALAKRELADKRSSGWADVESRLELLGLAAMSDRPRPGVKEAIAACGEAGIRVIMLTGDQPATARAIARELGIGSGGVSHARTLTGLELTSLPVHRQQEALQDAAVLARVTPEVKLSVVRALQAAGEVVAMTGDGVNDAPALRQADIGVAMGGSGTDLARDAANMVITDDNFSTIVKAIEQGRVIYSNIKRAIAYLLTASLASVVTISAAVLLDASLPLLPLQLLWLNLIMHVFPGLGIVLQPADPAVMRRAPRAPGARIVGLGESTHIVIRSVSVSLAVLAAILVSAAADSETARYTTIALSTISLSLLFQAWSLARVSRRTAGGKWSLAASKSLVLNMAASYALLLAAVYMPGLKAVLQTQPLPPGDWYVILVASLLSWGLSEAALAILRRSVSPLKRQQP